MVPIFRRLKLSPTLGFLGAGVILGPFGLGALQGELPWLRYVTIKNSTQMAQLAEFGVVFLLFAIGLELSWERLWTMRRLVFGLGGSQVVLCTAAIAGAAMLLGLDPVAAALLGSALALSSTAIVMPLLAEQKRQFSRPGRAAFSVLLLQDLAVAPILATIAVLGGHRGEAFSPKLLLAFAPAALGLIFLVVLGRLILRPMMRSVAKADSEELFVAASLLVVLGAGLVAAVGGLSMALGAFIAGLLLAETEYRKEVEKTVEPFKGLLLGLFFVSVGIGLDLSLLAERPILIVGLLLGLLVLNGGIVFALARLFGLRTAAAVETHCCWPRAANSPSSSCIPPDGKACWTVNWCKQFWCPRPSRCSAFPSRRRLAPRSAGRPREARGAPCPTASPTLGPRSWSSATAGWASSSPNC